VSGIQQFTATIRVNSLLSSDNKDNMIKISLKGCL